MMVAGLKRTIVGAVLLVAAGALPALAQQPTTQQVEQALATRPGAGSTVRAKIAASGLSPDQIRSRLRAAGYPDNLLDSYMDAAKPSDASETADDNVMRAVNFLGLVDAQELKQDSALTKPRVQQQGSEAASSTQIFGLDVFRRSTSQFEPDLAGPVDGSYKIGPRDMLALILTGGIENSYTLEVTREGFVVVPQVGQVYVANLTLDQASDAVFRRMQGVYSNIGRGPGAATHFFMTVAKLRTNQVFVVGDALAPGSYQVSSAGTLLTALYAAGGPSNNGSLRGIEVRRGGRTTGKLDVYDYLTKGDASNDVRLETGDVVFVPIHGPRVQLQGQVQRPATYELKKGETLRDLLQMAGGFTAEAGRQRLLVHRIVPPEQRTEAGRDRTVLDVTSDLLATGLGPALPLEDGDVVEVGSVAPKVRNRIAVTGAVWQPGTQGFQPGMKLSEAVRRAGGVKPDVKDALISRLQSDQTRRQLRATFTDTLGTVANDIALQEDDSVTVFGTSDFRPDRYVAITGAVNGGGRFPWREGMTVRDLVHLAGGMSDGAYLVQAEVARLPQTRENGTIAQTITIPLDSTYLLERGIDGKYHGPPGMQAPSATAPDFTLQPYDNVLILRQPDWQLERTVAVMGEVRFPGTYTLRSKQEKVSDMIQRAGGLLPLAYMPGAVFNRGQGGLGRVGIDLDRALKKKGSPDDVVMLPGDTLYIPRYAPTVKVQGAVNSPIAVTYVPGENIDYYISAAGGPRYDADPKRSYVQQPNGIIDSYKKHAVRPDHRPKPVAGSVVSVPVKDPNEKIDYTAIFTAIAQIIMSTVAIAAIALRK